MTLAARAKLGPYEIVSALGSGGMGEMYPESLEQPCKLAQCE
jgi:hypothetical protein